jgi:hypothetical protein
MTLVGGELRVAVAVALEDRSSEGGNEFEVLSAHLMYFVYANLLTLVGMFEVARPLTFRTPSTGGKSDKASRLPSLFGVARLLRGFSLYVIGNSESLLLRLARFDFCLEILLKGFLTVRFNKRHK